MVNVVTKPVGVPVIIVEIIRSGEHNNDWFGTFEEYPAGSKGMRSNKSENATRPVETSFAAETNFNTKVHFSTTYLRGRVNWEKECLRVGVCCY